MGRDARVSPRRARTRRCRRRSAPDIRRYGDGPRRGRNHRLDTRLTRANRTGDVERDITPGGSDVEARIELLVRSTRPSPSGDRTWLRCDTNIQTALPAE